MRWPRKRSGSSRPSSTLASVTVGRVPPPPKQAGPGREPALSGPTCSAPRSSIQPIEPPPAPIDVMSTVGAITGRRSTSVLKRSTKRCSWIRLDVEARAADVGADHVRPLQRPREGVGADDAAGRAGLERADRQLLGHGRRHHAAVGLHDREAAAEAPLGETALHAVEVGRDDGPDVRVQHDRRGALVLAPLRRDVVRRRHEDVRVARHGSRRRRPPRARGSRRRAGSRPRSPRRRRRPARGPRCAGRQVERLELLAQVAEPATHLAPQPPRHERCRRLPEEVVDVGAVAAPDLQHVAEPRGRDQPDPGALLLEDRVDGDRAAVDEPGQRLPADQPLVAREQALRDLVAEGRLLVDADLPGALVEQHEVDERPADVGGQAERSVGRRVHRSGLPR